MGSGIHEGNDKKVSNEGFALLQCMLKIRRIIIALSLLYYFRTVVTCPIPTFPPKLLTTELFCLNEDVPYNTTCQFACDVGYNLTGDSSVTCLEDSSSSASFPSCKSGFEWGNK